MYAAIIAGGSGTRLWPSSRKDKPKQFQVLYGQNSLLQETTNRLRPLIQQEDIYIIANAAHESIVNEQLEWLPKGNFIGEPVGKNTAPAVGIIATILHKKDPDAIIAILPSDHLIIKEERFRNILDVASKVAAEGENVVTIGLRPTGPATGYGYIQMSENHRFFGEIDVHQAVSFKEKPDFKTAEEYISSFHYVWNSGMFIWSAKTVLNLFRKHAPEIYSLLMRYSDAIGTPDESRIFDEVYRAFPSISVDYAILEHAENIFVIPASIGWNDLGSWSSLYEIMEQDDQGNAIIGKHAGIDTHGCLISSRDRLIATVGIDNLVIIDTGDVILVLPQGRSQEIKDLLDELKSKRLGEYL